jgi:hypothetical protein
MPAYLPVTPSTVNYAPAVFVGFVVIASLWYAVWGHKNYRGPPTDTLGEMPAVREEGAGDINDKED